jgi:hypothetical protein
MASISAEASQTRSNVNEASLKHSFAGTFVLLTGERLIVQWSDAGRGASL